MAEESVQSYARTDTLSEHWFEELKSLVDTLFHDIHLAYESLDDFKGSDENSYELTSRWHSSAVSSFEKRGAVTDSQHSSVRQSLDQIYKTTIAIKRFTLISARQDSVQNASSTGCIQKLVNETEPIEPFAKSLQIMDSTDSFEPSAANSRRDESSWRGLGQSERDTENDETLTSYNKQGSRVLGESERYARNDDGLYDSYKQDPSVLGESERSIRINKELSGYDKQGSGVLGESERYARNDDGLYDSYKQDSSVLGESERCIRINKELSGYDKQDSRGLGEAERYARNDDGLYDSYKQDSSVFGESERSIRIDKELSGYDKQDSRVLRESERYTRNDKELLSSDKKELRDLAEANRSQKNEQLMSPNKQGSRSLTESEQPGRAQMKIRAATSHKSSRKNNLEDKDIFFQEDFNMEEYMHELENVNSRLPTTNRERMFRRRKKTYFDFDDYYQKIISLHKKYYSLKDNLAETDIQ